MKAKETEMMRQEENWHMFVKTTKGKAERHMTVARWWNVVSNTFELSIIFLTSITTILVVLDKGMIVTSIVSGVAAMLSTVNGYLKPMKRRERQMEASKDFRVLMMRMVRCETDKEYEQLWIEYNKAILSEPFLSIPVQSWHLMDTTKDYDYRITPELFSYIRNKEKKNAGGAQAAPEAENKGTEESVLELGQSDNDFFTESDTETTTFFKKGER